MRFSSTLIVFKLERVSGKHKQENAIHSNSIVLISPQGTTDASFFAVITNEDEPVNIDFLKHHKLDKPAAKILINQGPRHGAFLCSPKDQIDLQDELCNAQTTYMPSPDFNGEDEFVYSYLHENLTTTADGKFMVRVIVRPKPDPVVANSDEVTMSLEDGHVHIPVLKNDVTKDKPDVCVTMHTDKPLEDKVTFEVRNYHTPEIRPLSANFFGFSFAPVRPYASLKKYTFIKYQLFVELSEIVSKDHVLHQHHIFFA